MQCYDALLGSETNMVSIRRRQGLNRKILITLIVGALSVFGLAIRCSTQDLHLSERPSLLTLFEQRQAVSAASQNAAQVKTWRKAIRSQCAAAKNKDDVLSIQKAIQDGFAMPSDPTPQPRDDRAVKRCKRVVVDFGANIGDTSGKMIDAGLVGCNRHNDLKASIPHPSFHVENKKFEFLNRERNPLTRNLVQLMHEFDESVGVEDYCYYGIEGNPVFTKRLQVLEDHIMGIRPRPIEHLHFFTETVGTGQDGITQLYLDTINGEHNFWGSSIFKEHQDVRKSAQAKDAKPEMAAANVTGYTLGTLMRKIMVAFDPDASEEDKKGGHFLLKVDIEGGEYPLLAQVAKEGTLCEYVKMGNQADLFIEYHSQRVTGKNSYVKKKRTVQKKLAECGVNFRKLHAWWA